MLKQFKNTFISSVITLAMFIAPQSVAGLMQVDVGMGTYVAGEGITFEIKPIGKDYFFKFIGGSVIKPSDDDEDFFYQSEDIAGENKPTYAVIPVLLPEVQYSINRSKWRKSNGAETGIGNWLKLLGSNDVTYWTEFKFDFKKATPINDDDIINPFVQVNQYRYMSDGSDFDLATAINGKATLVNHTDVPEPSTLAIFLLALMGFATHRFMKKN